MQLTVVMIQNGFVVTVQSQNGVQSLFFPTKELMEKAVLEIFSGIKQEAPDAPETKRN